MNCNKCPYVELCEVSKAERLTYCGLTHLRETTPSVVEECPLYKLLREATHVAL